jgi:hypothetical protein
MAELQLKPPLAMGKIMTNYVAEMGMIFSVEMKDRILFMEKPEMIPCMGVLMGIH